MRTPKYPKCQRCGKVYDAYGMSKYCPDCRLEKKKEWKKKTTRRRYSQEKEMRSQKAKERYWKKKEENKLFEEKFYSK
jgi:predicted  nucleic acid-binding Zn-ribbon protein